MGIQVIIAIGIYIIFYILFNHGENWLNSSRKLTPKSKEIIKNIFLGTFGLLGCIIGPLVFLSTAVSYFYGFPRAYTEKQVCELPISESYIIIPNYARSRLHTLILDNEHPTETYIAFSNDSTTLLDSLGPVSGISFLVVIQDYAFSWGRRDRLPYTIPCNIEYYKNGAIRVIATEEVPPFVSVELLAATKQQTPTWFAQKGTLRVPVSSITPIYTIKRYQPSWFYSSYIYIGLSFTVMFLLHLGIRSRITGVLLSLLSIWLGSIYIIVGSYGIMTNIGRAVLNDLGCNSIWGVCLYILLFVVIVTGFFGAQVSKQ